MTHVQRQTLSLQLLRARVLPRPPFPGRAAGRCTLAGSKSGRATARTLAIDRQNPLAGQGAQQAGKLGSQIGEAANVRKEMKAEIRARDSKGDGEAQKTGSEGRFRHAQERPPNRLLRCSRREDCEASPLGSRGGGEGEGTPSSRPLSNTDATGADDADLGQRSGRSPRRHALHTGACVCVHTHTHSSTRGHTRTHPPAHRHIGRHTHSPHEGKHIRAHTCPQTRLHTCPTYPQTYNGYAYVFTHAGAHTTHTWHITCVHIRTLTQILHTHTPPTDPNT